VPTMKFDYAETYGNHTAKYFQDYRSRALESSNSNYSRGGYFPSFYSYNGNSAVEARSRKWDQWLQSPHCRLSNVDHDNREKLINFAKVTTRGRAPHILRNGPSEEKGKGEIVQF